MLPTLLFHLFMQLPYCFVGCDMFMFLWCRGHQISVVLWGEAAPNFEAEEFIEIGNSEPVIAIFVGTLVKTYDGVCSRPTDLAYSSVLFFLS